MLENATYGARFQGYTGIPNVYLGIFNGFRGFVEPWTSHGATPMATVDFFVTFFSLNPIIILQYLFRGIRKSAVKYPEMPESMNFNKLVGEVV